MFDSMTLRAPSRSRPRRLHVEPHGVQLVPLGLRQAVACDRARVAFGLDAQQLLRDHPGVPRTVADPDDLLARIIVRVAKARAASSSATHAIMICDVVSTSNRGMTGPFPEMRVSRETGMSGTLGRGNTPNTGDGNRRKASGQTSAPLPLEGLIGECREQRLSARTLPGGALGCDNLRSDAAIGERAAASLPRSGCERLPVGGDRTVGSAKSRAVLSRESPPARDSDPAYQMQHPPRSIGKCPRHCSRRSGIATWSPRPTRRRCSTSTGTWSTR